MLTSTATKYVAPGGKTGPLRLSGPEGDLEVRTGGALALTQAVRTLGDEVLGRAARGAIPTQVVLSAEDIGLKAGLSRAWEISLSVSAPSNK